MREKHKVAPQYGSLTKDHMVNKMKLMDTN